MIYTYGFSIAGSMHIKNGTVCQDANKTVRLENGIVVAAVADGVGSCKYADVASTLAVDISVQMCVDEIMSGHKRDPKKVIENAFAQAEKEIENHCLAQNHMITEYDTTLSLVIYDGRRVAYGHSGDGGIIGLTSEGDYVKITAPQKSDGLYVIPLRAGKEKWVIERPKECYASLLLATDGVYDNFFPYLLKGQPVEAYIPLLRYFMDNNLLQVTDDIETLSKERKDFLNSEACAVITDDKTIVVLINGESRPNEKEESYYQEPDWEALQQAWNKKAYPHLGEEKTDAVGIENDDAASPEKEQTIQIKGGK